GMGFEEMRDFGYHEMMHPDEVDAFQKGLAQASASGLPHVSEMRFKDKNGQYIWHLNIASPILDAEGKITMWVGSTTDIQTLKEEEQRKSDFVSMLSHELRTPVTSIKGYVQLLLRQILREEGFSLKTVMVNSLSRIDILLQQLTGLISDMLDLSRIDAGRLDLKLEEFTLDALVAEVLEDSRMGHPKHQFNLKAENGVLVHADRNRISQVLINLISNAIKYSPSSNVIDVVVSSGVGEVRVSIRDYGIGIDEKDQVKVFQRFYRVEGQNEQYYTGFGIGLFLVNSIVERHKGSMSLVSKPNQGSVFTVHLPV
ncbi:MAG: PAS domain S-box protein, partial [Pedobacter sp.]